MLNRISFQRLLEINSDLSKITKEEESIIYVEHAVYLIFNESINKAYIGETDNVFIRLFSFWKEDKRHVTGINAPINTIFNSDYPNTYFQILEANCDNKEREYYWHEHYRSNTDFIILSHPGRHGCDKPGNYGLIAIHKDNKQTYINKEDFSKFEKDGWILGGKKNRPRTISQKETISKAHIGLTPWNKGKLLSDDEKKKYRGIKKARGIFKTPSGELIEMCIGSVKKYHKDWILQKEL